MRTWIVSIVVSISCGLSYAQDCNGNGIDDAMDIESGASADCDGNRIPDECDLQSLRASFKAVESAGSLRGPRAIIPGDFDGDGDIDLLVTPRRGEQVSLVRNLGDGVFSPSYFDLKALKPLSNGVRIVSPGDIDGDGDLDLLVETSSIQWVENDGTGRFVALHAFAENFEDSGLVDVDGDGDLDLVSYLEPEGRFLVRWNDPDFPGFARVTESSPAIAHSNWVSGDVDGDGLEDLSVVIQGSMLRVYRGDGLGDFEAWVDLPAERNDIQSRIEARDFNGDGVTDFSVYRNRAIKVWIGLGEGVFADPVESYVYDLLGFGDVDGDGIIDAFAHSLDDYLIVSSCNDDGSFSGPYRTPLSQGVGAGAVVDLDGDGRSDVATVLVGLVAYLSIDLEAPADCNEDGVPDDCQLEDRNRNGVLDECEPDCNANGVPDEYEAERGGDLDGDLIPDECQLGRPDCDGDGIPDSEELYVGSASDCDENGVPDECDLAQDASRDCDGDGVLDDCASNSDLTWEAARALDGHGSHVFGDFNGDGRIDIFSHGEENRLIVQFSRGHRLFAPAREATDDPLNRSISARRFLAGDSDGDGDLDVLGATDSGPVWFLNDGRGNFTRGERFLGSPREIALGDIDGDSILDVVFTERERVVVVFGDGIGGFSGSSDLAVVRDASAPTVADLDGDGLPEVLFLSASLSVIRNASKPGEAIFSEPVDHELSDIWARILMADLDRDGDIDVIVPPRRDGPRIQAFINDGNGSLEGRVVQLDFEGRDDIDLLEVEDLDRDGDPDFVFLLDDDLWFTPGDGDLGFKPSRKLSAGARPGLQAEVFDLDRDGLIDIVVNPGNYRLGLLYAEEPAVFPAPSIGRADQYDAAVLDLQEDGDLDIAVLMDQGILQFRNEDREFVAGEWIEIGHDCRAIETVDFDGDGRVEFLVAYRSGLAILKIGSDGIVGPPETVEFLGDHALMAVGDLDGDLDPDVVVAQDHTTSWMPLLNTGNSFVPGGRLSGVEDPLRADIVDLDGDMDLDVVISSWEEFTISWNLGDGRFDDGRHEPGFLWGPTTELSDLDANGVPEIIVKRGDELHWVQVQRSTGLFETVKSELLEVRANVHPKLYDYRDLNADGLKDVILADYNADSFFVYRAKGQSQFDVAGVYRTVDSPERLLVDDFDADGHMDLFISSRSDFELIFGRVDEQPDEDCNGNGIPDVCEIADGMVSDLNANAIPDECERPLFRRGDANVDGEVDLSDAIHMLEFLFIREFTLACTEAADIDNNSEIAISDPIVLLRVLFLGENVIARPSGELCGEDLDAPGSAGDLGCAGFDACPSAQ